MTTRPAARLVNADGFLRTRLEHGRGGPRRGLDRVRSRLLLIAQTSLAAGLAWELAKLVQPRPYFAPVAAVIALSATAGQHLPRAGGLAFGGARRLPVPHPP